jgi:hypothetical protein
MESTSSKSPWTNCTCGSRFASAFRGSRVTARTCTPWAHNLLMTSLPTVPVAPVIRIIAVPPLDVQRARQPKWRMRSSCCTTFHRRTQVDYIRNRQQWYCVSHVGVIAESVPLLPKPQCANSHPLPSYEPFAAVAGYRRQECRAVGKEGQVSAVSGKSLPLRSDEMPANVARSWPLEA